MEKRVACYLMTIKIFLIIRTRLTFLPLLLPSPNKNNFSILKDLIFLNRQTISLELVILACLNRKSQKYYALLLKI
ncbi:hypothetical protein BpHYR1_030327 [Brachionus plicatilis]|uniref:Uncharacterized protein n=1 Tax=Brachionus plicatilis TaxID=10195 RepID=A0A3M7RRA1_BRAPC|nr:hypothetical protein BpHYR1_030327 [Brachionus plicatilis]